MLTANSPRYYICFTDETLHIMFMLLSSSAHLKHLINLKITSHNEVQESRRNVLDYTYNTQYKTYIVRNKKVMIDLHCLLKAVSVWEASKLVLRRAFGCLTATLIRKSFKKKKLVLTLTAIFQISQFQNKQN